MQFTTFTTIALAAMAVAMPSTELVAGEGEVLLSLPAGCKKTDLIKCAIHLIGTTASCGAAIVEVGANVLADLKCVQSAASTANKFSECKSCIPKKTTVV